MSTSGQEAKVKVVALGEKEIKAVVTQKNPLAIAKSDTQGGLSNRVNVQEAKEFKVTLELRELADDSRSKLRPGMSATATITTKTKNNVIAVPLQAIVEKAPPTPAPGPTVASSAPPPPGEKAKEIKGVYTLDKAWQGEVRRSHDRVSLANPISKSYRDCRQVPKLSPGQAVC
jgi:HlyD family secretion protein